MTDVITKQRKTAQLNGIWYLLAGGGIGATLALLFAPKSGVELRTDISDLTHKSYHETVELAHQLKEQSNEAYNALKEKTGKIYGLAATKWPHLSKTASELPNEVIDGAAKLVEENTSLKKAVSRKSAAIL